MLTKYILLLLIIINCNSNHILNNNIKLLDKKNYTHLILKNKSSVIKKLSRTIEKEYIIDLIYK